MKRGEKANKVHAVFTKRAWLLAVLVWFLLCLWWLRREERAAHCLPLPQHMGHGDTTKLYATGGQPDNKIWVNMTS